MKIIRIEAVWCSSCLIMKSRMQECARDKNVEWISIDYEDAEDLLKEYKISTDILPIYIRQDNQTFLIGEHNKKEISRFLEEI